MDLPRAPRSAAARVVVVLIAASIATGCSVHSAAEPASSTASIASAGFTRTYRVYRPAAAPRSVAVPLVIVLHAAGGGGAGAEKLTGFDHLADSAGFIVAYPDAKDGGLWEWGCCAANPLRVATSDNQFVGGLIDHLVATEHVDPTRVYLAGFSIGAVFAHRLACQLAGKITAIGSVGGTEQIDRPCAPSRPVSIIEIKGEQPDEWYGGSCPVNGICTPFTKGYTPSAPQIDRQWRSLDHCPSPSRTDLSPDVHVSTAAPCAKGTKVVLVSIDATGSHGHHCWPGSSGCTGPPDATSYLWNQFAGLRSPGATTRTPVAAVTTSPTSPSGQATEPRATNSSSAPATAAPEAHTGRGTPWYVAMGLVLAAAALAWWTRRRRTAPRR